MRISTPAFEDGETIPQRYTCDGEDISPKLKLEDVPPESESLAIVVDDPDAPGGVFDHWVIWNIPSEIKEIPENVPIGEKVDSLERASQGKNGFGEFGYRGPCPPPGPSHKYRFKLYALDTSINLEPGVLKEDLEREMEGCIIERDSITGIYGR